MKNRYLFLIILCCMFLHTTMIYSQDSEIVTVDNEVETLVSSETEMVDNKVAAIANETQTELDTKENKILNQLFSPADEEKVDGVRLEKKKMEAVDYVPHISGTIRGKYEYCPQLEAGRFQVRNARFSLTGNVHQMVAYKAEIDLSDKGVTKMLDAYVKVMPIKSLSLSIGQMKIPFSTDNLRSPYNMYFANRAFVAKQITGLRDVGFTASYNAKKYVPITLTAGVYNGDGLYDQSEWQQSMSYSARMEYKVCKHFAFDLNWQSVEPEYIRLNFYDIGLRADVANFHFEVEGLYKTYGTYEASYGVYTDDVTFDPSYGFTGMINYDILLPKVFHKVSVLARYDMMNDMSSGYLSSGSYVADEVARQRVTTGVTLTLGSPILAELRINYEKYFYEDWSLADDADKDKIVVEVVARF